MSNEFYLGLYNHKSSGKNVEEPFIMLVQTINDSKPVTVKEGLIFDKFGEAYFTGILDKDKMTFVKNYNNKSEKGAKVPIQYTLKRTKKIYTGNYSLANRNGNISDCCIIRKVNFKKLIQKVLEID